MPNSSTQTSVAVCLEETTGYMDMDGMALTAPSTTLATIDEAIPASAPPTEQDPKARPSSKHKKRRGRKGKPGAQVGPQLGGKDSDHSTASTPKLDFSRMETPPPGSPLVRPSSLSRAISELKLAASKSNSPASSEKSYGRSGSSGETSPERCSLRGGAAVEDVPIIRDFAADQLTYKPMYALEGGLRRDSPRRKMNASDFEPLKVLGKGAFGTVLLVKQHSTGRLFAQKQLKKATLTVEQRLIDQTKTERAILESVNRHPFVVKLFYAFQDHAKLYLILEYAQGGELFHHLAMERTFTEEVAAFYMAEMILALDHLHRNLGVVYRDLKPENCLLDAEGHLLLTDFGLSKVAVEDPESEDGYSKCNSFLGTIDYMAPEVVAGKDYDQAVDWWSLGALGYDLLTGSPPFTANNHTKIQQKILQGKLNLPYYLSPDAKDLLIRLMRKDPRKRLGGNMPKDLPIIKSHRFFRKLDWKLLQNRELIAPIQPIITDPASAENFDAEFTDLAMSPTVESMLGKNINAGSLGHTGRTRYGSVDDTFGGFSFVASQSLLDCEL